ncbi:hypothetical protein COCC4DRAFT_192922 [Bipolaris maydis ATCC 48331]|uniref:RING-type domain-containing protein n=2 Tax=Cochliobolus heterostrophus TaxID=5016 RepID=M2UHX0_COCH5|nr:uncharacterized protein COCC4DRAFT_192922 [Bipolaris maydis ATCC 48331]EMD87598.1 hypothetical protein COCHEDRAFT_1217757 [Bipolaris maydis C5]KAJ5023136.1 hypothetical protein J3E73DRAFT_384529 [Bipolaris maydis]ENI06797.1 hypothetical protein COCC4DRAFT_192922 [Bipolaris maydis ATCC 48331]KAJ5056114.1 hypothetical protein J3E74DRAFT_421882 [Bipolaris maydis]KAJ6193863.1 hypothetical protein J3E72DRAFT_388593 [Bipolaris maydis]
MSQQMYTREEFLFFFINPTTTSSYMTAECTICREPFSSSPDGCAVTFSDKESCKHVFCKPCITQWLRTKGVNSCPTCRRQLFVLDNEYYDDDDFSDGEDEEEDEDEDEDEEEEGEAEVFFTNEEIMELLEDTWYKVFWLLDEHRRSVSRADSTVHEEEDDEDDEDELATKPPLHSSTLLHSFMRTVASRVDTYYLNDATGFATGMKINVLSCILLRITAELVKRIESTSGKGKVPAFSRETAAEWEGPLKWVMGYM